LSVYVRHHRRTSEKHGSLWFPRLPVKTAYRAGAHAARYNSLLRLSWPATAVKCLRFLAALSARDGHVLNGDQSSVSGGRLVPRLEKRYKSRNYYYFCRMQEIGDHGPVVYIVCLCVESEIPKHELTWLSAAPEPPAPTHHHTIDCLVDLL